MSKNTLTPLWHQHNWMDLFCFSYPLVLASSITFFLLDSCVGRRKTNCPQFSSHEKKKDGEHTKRIFACLLLWWPPLMEDITYLHYSHKTTRTHPHLYIMTTHIILKLLMEWEMLWLVHGKLKYFDLILQNVSSLWFENHDMLWS